MAKHDRGSALVMAVFVLALLTGLGVALLFLSQSTVRQTRAGLRAKKAFYMAEAGIEHGRFELYTVADLEFDDDLTTAAGDGTLDLDVGALDFTWDASGNVDGIVGAGNDVPIRPLTQINFADTTGWYAAYLTNDPLESGGMSQMTDTNNRLMITAIGGSQRRSTEVVQAILEPFHYVPPVPPAAITMLGPPPYFYNGTSNAQRHTGNDCGVTGGPFAPIVGTISSSARDQVVTDAERLDATHFASDTFGGSDTIADLNDDSDPTGIVNQAGHGTLDPIWMDCAAMKALVAELTSVADYYCNPDNGTCVIPSTSASSITVIDGDLIETPVGQQYGVLLVTGTLTYKGNTDWDGVILAIGEGHIVRSGGGNGQPSGAVIMAAIDPTPNGPNANKSDWCTTGDNGFNTARYETSGGGNSEVEWCTGNINAANPVEAYRVVQFLQR